MTTKKKDTQEVRVPQQDRAKRKVNRIISAARKHFSKYGYAKTTMSRIAREARVSTGTAYAYFTDKNDVLLKVLDVHVEEILRPAEGIMANLPENASLRTTLHKLIECSTGTHRQDPGLHMIFHERIMKDEKFRAMVLQYRERGLDIGRELVKRFADARVKKDTETAAQVLVGLLEFCTHIGLLYPSKVSTERACEVGIDMIAAYIDRELT